MKKKVSIVFLFVFMFLLNPVVGISANSNDFYSPLVVYTYQDKMRIEVQALSIAEKSTAYEIVYRAKYTWLDDSTGYQDVFGVGVSDGIIIGETMDQARNGYQEVDNGSTVVVVDDNNLLNIVLLQITISIDMLQ